MSLESAANAARKFNADEIKAAASGPGNFARSHRIEVADAIPIITREQGLRKTNKIWRK